MPQAIGMMCHKVVRQQSIGTFFFLYSPFQRIGSAGRRPVLVHQATLVSKKGAGLIVVISHIEHNCRKIWVTALGKTCMSTHKLGRTNSKRLLQPEHIVGVQIEFKLTAAIFKTADLRVATKLKGFTADVGTAFWNQVWRDSIMIHFISIKKADMTWSYQLYILTIHAQLSDLLLGSLFLRRIIGNKLKDRHRCNIT